MKVNQSQVKKINQGETMPDDFWNYRVNPITGYYIPTVFSGKTTGSYKDKKSK